MRGLFDSIVAGIKEDGRTRCIDDYLSFRLKVHGIFEDVHDEFDPERHSLSLAVAPLRELRPSFKEIAATNPNHKRQFRIYSVKASDAEDCKDRTVFWRRDIIVKGAEFPLDDSLYITMYAKGRGARKEEVQAEPQIVSRSNSELRLAWPEEFSGEDFMHGSMDIVLTNFIDPDNAPDGIKRREFRRILITNPE